MKAIDRARRKKEKNECIIKAKNSAMTPSLTWAPPWSEVPLPPVLREMKENIPPSCQRAQVHNPYQYLQMCFKTLWKDACKEFRKEEAHELFKGMMDKSFVSPC